MDLPSVINGPLALVLFILGFGFIIFVHELGHFLVAKWVGVKVTQFAIGMGHAVLSWRKGLGFRAGSSEREYEKRLNEEAARMGIEVTPEKRLSDVQQDEIGARLGLSETEYRLNWLPLGGCVKMVGQDDMDPTALSENPRAFNKKPIWARMAVVSAGVIMNGIFAVIFFVVAFMYGVDFPPAVVGSITPGSPAAVTPAENKPGVVGLAVGDRIVSINGKAPSDHTDLALASALAAPDTKLDIVVERPAADAGKPAEKLAFQIPTATSRATRLQYIGVFPPQSLQLARGEAEFRAQLNKLGVEPEMVLTKVNGEPVQHHWQYYRLMEKAAGKPMQLTFEPGKGQKGEPRTITIRPSTHLMVDEEAENPVAHLLGMVPVASAGAVVSGTPADGKIEAGDLFLAIGDEKYPSQREVIDTVKAAEGKAVKLKLLRDGKTVEVEITPKKNMMGVVLEPQKPIVSRVLDDSPFAALNLPEGTQILAVNGEKIESLADLRGAIERSGDSQITLEYHTPLAGGLNETKTVSVSADQRRELSQLLWQDPLPFQMLREKQQASSVGEALHIGLDKTRNFMLQTYVTLARLFQGRVKVEHLRGPLGIVTEGSTFAQKGIPYLLFFLGLISISVAVFNFLPIPIVDGGLAVLLLIEKLRGKPVPPQVASAINMVGLVLLGTLFLTVTYYDVMRQFIE